MTAVDHHMSRADYLERSQHWTTRHEWVNGEAFAMSGGSFRHNAIATNISTALTTQLRGSGCRATSSDQRVFVVATSASLYPDVLAVCGPFEAAPDDPRGLVNPAVIVEVLSPSTRDHDLGAKLQHYLQIPSLNHVVYVEADDQHVIHYARNDEGWQRRDLTEGTVVMQKPDVQLPLDLVYGDLDQIP
jgi:Uma2 family endonuclease